MSKLLKSLFLIGLLVILPSSALAQTPTPTTCPEVATLCVAGKAMDLFPNDAAACEQFVCMISRGFTQGNAPSPWYNQTPQEFSKKVFAPGTEMFGERYTYAQINWILNSLIAMMNPVASNPTPEGVVEFLKKVNDINNALKVINSNNKEIELADYVKLGPMGIMAVVGQYPFAHPLVSGVGELQKTISRVFDIAQPVQAQGLGYSKLGQGNVQALWAAMRNISYLCIIVLLIAAGFMVMFQTRINPQTVVSVQMIIPKLISSLLLITFSYAIVGFVLDMIYVVNIALIGLLNVANPAFYSAGITYTVSRLVGENFNFVMEFLMFQMIASVIIIVVGAIISAGVSVLGNVGIVGLMITGFFAGFFAWSLYTAARIIGQLFVAYLNIAILTIFGPLQIMMDIIPNQKGGFWSWFKCVVGNASVFVSYTVLAIVARALLDFGGLGFNRHGFDIDQTRLFLAYTLPGANFSGFGGWWGGAGGALGLSSWIMSVGVSIAFFTACPNIVAGIRDAFCKGEDYSKFLESMVKDTVGQITSAGKEASKGVDSIRKGEASYFSGDKIKEKGLFDQ